MTITPADLTKIVADAKAIATSAVSLAADVAALQVLAAVPPVSMASPEGTIIPPATQVTDKLGGVRTIVGGQITRMVGSITTTDPVTSDVTDIAIHLDVLWQRNTSGDWYAELAPGSGTWSASTKTAPVTVPAAAPAPAPTPAGTLLQVGKPRLGGNSHRDQNQSIGMAQQIADMITIHGPGCIFRGGFEEADGTYAADVAACLAAGIHPLAVYEAFPPFPFASEAAAYNWAYADVAAMIAKYPGIELIELTNEMDIAAVSKAHANDGSKASDWIGQPLYHQMQGAIAGGIAACFDHAPNAKVISGSTAGWSYLGIVAALAQGLSSYMAPGASSPRNLMWHYSTFHWYRNLKGDYGPVEASFAGYDALAVLKLAGVPGFVSECGSSSGTSDQSASGAMLATLFSDLLAHSAITAESPGIVAILDYPQYASPGETYCMMTGPGQVSAQGQAVINWRKANAAAILSSNGAAPSPAPAAAPAPAATGPVCGLAGYRLAAEWTFGPGGTIPDMATLQKLFYPGWTWGRINGELQRYVTDWNPANIAIVGNELHFIATPTRGMGMDQIDSAEIISKAPWPLPPHGLIEWTYKPPAGLGMFPAGWLYPYAPTDASEIDGFEHVFNNPDGSRDTTKKIFVNDHLGNTPAAVETGSKLDQWGAYIPSPAIDFAQGYHTAAVQFEGDAKTRWVDQTAVITRTWKWTGPAPNIVVDLACGSDGTKTDWPGTPNAGSFQNGANVLALRAIRTWVKP